MYHARSQQTTAGKNQHTSTQQQQIKKHANNGTWMPGKG
jgi:hypothetical protein